MTEYWVYVGEGLATNEVKIKSFKVLSEPNENSHSVMYGDLTGEERHFKIGGSYVLGGVYSVEVERKDDKVTITKNSFQFQALYDDKEFVEKVRLEQRLFEEEQRIKKFEKKHYSKYELPEKWQDIVFTYGRFKTFTERRLFESMLLDELRKQARNKNNE